METGPIFILAYGSLVWDLDDLAPRVEGGWRMGIGPTMPLEFSRISPKRKQSLVVVIDERGDPCPTHAIRSIRTDVEAAATDLMLRERTSPDFIGLVDCVTGARKARRPAIADRVETWCRSRDARGAVWTDLNSNFDGFTIPRALAYLRGLNAESLAAAEQYINCAPVETDTPLRRRLARDPWWRDVTLDYGSRRAVLAARASG